MYYAHTHREKDWEPLRDHLERSAARAEAFATTFEAGPWARLAGLWHDLGKYSEAFQSYLLRSTAGDEGAHRSELTGTVDHSTAGAKLAAGRGMAGRLLAYCIAGHHAGLPDNEDEEGGTSSLRSRLAKKVEPIAAAPAELLGLGLPPLPSLRAEGDRAAFALAFFTRMLFSCLVDADFLATEWYIDPERAGRRVGGASCAELLGRLDRHLVELQEKPIRVNDTPVNRRRREVLEACRAKAGLGPGFFSLNVPTGGGKTLSSLAFALRHAAAHGLRRVVYAIPFTSIIEQTADVFRKALDDLGGEVLEHHGNLDPDDPDRQSNRSRLAAENFDASLVVTTNVQLFESLFASRTSRCRKLHRLAGSVIILDEAQTLPPRLLAPTLAALEELVKNYGATVLLCTATQPAVERREDFAIGLADVRPIIEEPCRLHQALRRTAVELVGPWPDDELVRRLRGETQALCVVNSRRHAAAIFAALDDRRALHLSASMCAAHRAKVIKKIRRWLKAGSGAPCRVVSSHPARAREEVPWGGERQLAALASHPARAREEVHGRLEIVLAVDLPRTPRGRARRFHWFLSRLALIKVSHPARAREEVPLHPRGLHLPDRLAPRAGARGGSQRHSSPPPPV